MSSIVICFLFFQNLDPELRLSQQVYLARSGHRAPKARQGRVVDIGCMKSLTNKTKIKPTVSTDDIELEYGTMVDFSRLICSIRVVCVGSSGNVLNI